MGILCCCCKKKNPTDYNGLDDSLNPTVEGKTIEDLDEWEIRDLKNKNATLITIVDEGSDPGPSRKVNVEDFQFLKVFRKIND